MIAPAELQDVPQPDFSRWLIPTAHNVSALVPSMCSHGAEYLVVDPDDVPSGRRTRIAGTIADGRVVVSPPVGESWVRAKYMTANMTCVVDAGRPRPDDLSAPAANRPADLCSKPTRVWIAEPYDAAVHGEITAP